VNRAKNRRKQKLNRKVEKSATAEQPPAILQSLALAVAHHQAGRLAEAEELYRQIMVLAPDQPFAPYMLGAMAHQSGNDEGAVDLLSKAIAVKPDMAQAHNALGLALRALGRADDAVASCHRALAIKTNYAEALNTLGLALRDLEQFEGAAVNLQKAVTINPNFADAHSNLGLVLYDLGKLDEAVTSYRKALAINPNFAEAHSNLGNTQKDLGRLDEAIACYDRALAIKSDYVEAHCQLANAFKLQGKLEVAVTTYQKALAINPNFAAAHINLGLVLQDLGKLDEAIISYRKALAINPDFAEAYCILGNALRNLENLSEAVTCHRCAVSLDPQNDSFWACLAASLEFYPFTSADDDLWQDLLHLLERPTVRPSSVVRSVFSALRHNPNFAQIVAQADPLAPDSGVADWDAAERLSEIPLFLLILGLSPIRDLQIERMLTTLRHTMLRETIAGRTTKKGLPFSAALALQCFTNEYVFSESDEERENVENLQQKIAMLVETKCDVPPLFIAALGAYRPLYRFPWAQQLANRAWDGAIKEVIEQQISEPLIEQSLRPKISLLTTVQDTVSQSVRQQYEENPYPRWIKTDIQGNGHSIRDVLQGPLTRLDLGDYQSPDSPEILVAGCGTGAHPLNTATKFLNAQILALDLSLSSLAYALRKTAELGISNISYAQGPDCGERLYGIT
jgi:tetratricopeptide (TPR) repeat protein